MEKLAQFAWRATLSFVFAVSLSAQGDDPKLHFAIAEAALKKGDLRVAEVELAKALENDPNNAVLWYNLAVVQSKENRPSRAMGSLDEAFKLGIPAEDKDAAIELKGSLVYEMREWSKVQAISGTWSTSARTNWEKPSRVRGVPCYGASDDSEIIALKFDDGEGILAGTYVVFSKYIDKNQSWDGPASDHYHEECRKLYEGSTSGRVAFNVKARWDTSSRSIKLDASASGASGRFSGISDKHGTISLDADETTLTVVLTDEWGTTRYKRAP